MCQRKHSVYLNAKLEQGFQKLGTSIASRPLVYLCITFIAIAALSLGWLAGQERVNGIEELWVEKGSRIHGENDVSKCILDSDCEHEHECRKRKTS